MRVPDEPGDEEQLIDVLRDIAEDLNRCAWLLALITVLLLLILIILL